jgi:hypothetical protein
MVQHAQLSHISLHFRELDVADLLFLSSTLEHVQALRLVCSRDALTYAMTCHREGRLH